MLKLANGTSDILAAAAHGDLRIGRVRLAKTADARRGYAPGALVPERPRRLNHGLACRLTMHQADTFTPSGLRLSWGRCHTDTTVIERARREAGASDFTPGDGTRYRLAGRAGQLIDVLTAPPRAWTTTVYDPRIAHYSMGGQAQTAQRVGLHLDNSPRERLPAFARGTDCPPRLLYNAGPGDRWLIVGLDVTAADTVRGPDEIPTQARLLELFARSAQARAMRCLWVRLAAGAWAQVCAGMAVHDGSTWTSARPSSLIVLGLPTPTQGVDSNG